MSKNEAEIQVGDLVSLKTVDLKSEFVFVWNILGEGPSTEIIINLPPEIIKKLNLKRVEDNKLFSLFSLRHYAIIKKYDIQKRSLDTFQETHEVIKMVLQERRGVSYSAEFFFEYSLLAYQDFHHIDELFISSIIPSIINDKYCTLSKNEIEDFNNDQITSKLREVILPIFLVSKNFWFIKKAKNFSAIADKIITDDGRPMLKRLQEDRSLLKTFLTLSSQKSDYSKAVYSPVNTHRTKPIIHELNQSFYHLIKDEVKEFSRLMDNKSEFAKNLGNLELEKIFMQSEEQLLSGIFPKMQQLLFSDLGSELPIRKLIAGKVQRDYNLQFYIPFFKWMMPNRFVEYRRLEPSEIRKQHIRGIKDFIAGKI